MNNLLGHIRWLLRSRRTRRLDEIALGIADKYGMRKEYLTARKYGLDPISAMEDWDLLMDEDRKLLIDMEKGNGEQKNNDRTKLDMGDMLSIIISFVALVFSVISYHGSSKTTMLVNSKEYEMSQSMKFDMVELVAVLRSIDDKAAMNLYRGTDVYFDFSHELQLIRALQTRPGYLVFLYSIDNRPDRYEIEKRLKMLAGYYLVSPAASMTDIRWEVERVLTVLSYHSDFKDMQDMDYEEMINFLCSAKNHEPVNEGYRITEHDTRYKEFLELLMKKGYDDPNIQYYYYTFCVPDSTLAHDAYLAGARPIDFEISSDPFFWEWSLWENFIEAEYRDEYGEFCRKR